MPKSLKPKKFTKKIAKKNPSTKSKPVSVASEHTPTKKKRTLFFTFKKRSFWIFFLQSFLVTGILLLLILIFSALFEVATYSLAYIKDSYTIHPYPQVTRTYENLNSPLSYAIFEKDSRSLVDSRNASNLFSPASTAKLITTLVALDYYNPLALLKVQNIKSVEGSKMGLVEGEVITVKNLLYGLLLPSGNDAAYVLAAHYPGGVKGFVSKMNAKAGELKLSNTHFEDPAGYEDKNYTTAWDLVHLASYTTDNPLVQEIVKTREKVVYDTMGKIAHNLTNLNELLNIPGVNGIKTGFTEEAGGVLTTSYVYQGKTYIIVVMKSADRFADTRALLKEINTVSLTSF